MPGPRSGLVIAAPQSGSGKTVFTLGLLRALRDAGHPIASAKSGPDYIDPKFHEAATGTPCLNLDAWAMSAGAIKARAQNHTPPGAMLVVEGAMGLFDGSAAGKGSTADLAAILGLPVVLVVDASKQAQSIAALAHGFASLRDDTALAAIILNRVGSPRHERILRQALEPIGIPVLGALSNDKTLALPSRHLGLVQAGEIGDLEDFIQAAAAKIETETDIAALISQSGVLAVSDQSCRPLPPLGQRTAIARDTAFAFCYPHLLRDWRDQGCELSFFSPLADEAPRRSCDSIYLPGGYPELWGETLAQASNFRTGMQEAANRAALIYGECGGYMVLGEALTDAEGKTHPMLGLLPLETSFQARQRHLGYRRLTPTQAAPWTTPLNAHEFHYSTLVREGAAERLFLAEDAEARDLGPIGLSRNGVSGSYAHIIDRA